MKFPIDRFQSIRTPFYYYDLDLLSRTVAEAAAQTGDSRYHIHYALKANANPLVLAPMREAGWGVDCVSGNEVEAAVVNGFSPDSIVFAGVGKTDEEINYALGVGIGCFNVESLPELEVISELASARGVTAKVALRVNPNIDAHTHHYITTGLNENKFGIDLRMLDDVVDKALALPGIKLVGLHFHIGSQLTDMEPYRMLCDKINELQAHFAEKGITFSSINVGGGLGIDYENPDADPIPDFKSYFEIFRENLKLGENQQLHFELGRSIVAQCGSLISRVIYVKNGVEKQFAIIDAGMSDLLRPALYGAHHKIENISSPDAKEEVYDVVGPICESSDVFGKDEKLPALHRGSLVALRSAGAYGETMASRYNLRALPASYTS
ncbi:MAG: diaminopimelate decarboxylase [Muribaculaceae bacterium]|nr:diaminopimelate decarboxylase [Muribaculaceae bacterium]